MRSGRWPLAAALFAATATAAFLGAALAETSGGAAAGLVVAAIVAFLLAVGAGGLWGRANRQGPAGLAVERAEVTSQLAHEVRSPLMAIKGLASTADRLFDQMSEDERREFFRLIDEEAARLQRVTDQSATAMRVDADLLVFELREEDLGALVEEVAWSTPHAEHPMNVETVPELDVRVDRKHLGEAIANLIDNAMKYSPPDAPIDVAAKPGPDGTAVVEVADRGPGIPANRLEDVFRRFARWRPAGYEETPGAGLGLFIARAYVTAQGGRLDLAAREDGGTILRISLPAQREGRGQGEA